MSFIHMTKIFVKFLQIQGRSPFIMTSLRFRYCKVLSNILSLYQAHLTDGSFLKKPSDLSIEDIGGFSRDGRIARSNPLPRSMFDPGRLVAFPDYINVH